MPEADGAAFAATAYRTLSGTVVARPALIRRLGRAAWLVRVVYNACIDSRVPFAEGVAQCLAVAAARRDGTAPPPEPVRSETFLPVLNEAETKRRLTELLRAHPELREIPRSVLDHAVDDACKARRRHVADARAAGCKAPTLHFCSARAAWSVSTRDFMLLRVGDGPAHQKPRRRRAGTNPKTLRTDGRNARRRENREIHREVAWAEEKRRCGWNENRIAFHLERRATRQQADRERQKTLEAERRKSAAAKAAGEPPRVRRDSPKAVVGERRMKADVLGLGRFRMNLGEAVPESATITSLCLVKPAWRGAKIEARVTMTVPTPKPVHDEDAVRATLYGVAGALPAGATPLAAVRALRASGLLGRGEDLGVAHPSCDDTGARTRPVRLSRPDHKAMRAAQRSLSHKDLCRAKTAHERRDGEEPFATDDHVGGRRGRRGRSKNALREVERMRALSHRASERSRTRALQDAKALLRDDPVLVATDPTRMVKPLYVKGGPAGRRTALAAGTSVPAVLVDSRTDDRGPFRLSAGRQRAMRRNLHRTRFGERITRVGLLCERIGAVHLTPGHEGTTSGCPGCDRVRAKTLGERWHSCPCGVEMPRDQASALITLGRAVLMFRVGPDPGGLLAARREREAEDRAKREKRLAAMKAGAAKAQEIRRAAKAALQTGGVSSPTQGVVPLGHLVPDKPKRVRNQGRNVRRAGWPRVQTDTLLRLTCGATALQADSLNDLGRRDRALSATAKAVK